MKSKQSPLFSISGPNKPETGTELMPEDHVLIEELNNLGPVSKKMLAEIDVHTAGDIRALGPDLIYHILRGKGTMVSMNLVYALAAAIQGIHWNDLSPEEKRRLTTACKVDARI